MPVTGCTWRSSPNAPGCWDRGEPPRPVRVGHSHPTAWSLHLRSGSFLAWSRSRLPLLGRFWRLCGARRSWFDVGAGTLAAPVARDATEAPHSGVAAGDILRVWGHFCVAGGILRVGGRDCCPRRRRMPPPGTTRTRPRGMSPAGSDGVAAGGSLHLLPGVLRSIRPSRRRCLHPRGRADRPGLRRSPMPQSRDCRWSPQG